MQRDDMADPKHTHDSAREFEAPSNERVDVSLLIYPRSLSPAEVTKRLGISPTDSSSVKVTSPGRGPESPASWFLESEGFVSSMWLEDHLKWLLDRIEASAQSLLELQRVEGVVMAVKCVWWSLDGTGGPTLSTHSMQRLADLNLELGFDVYYFGDEEEEEIEDGKDAT